MAHEIAKLLLEHAGTILEREEAIKTAIYLGMPLREVEDYLDWVDSIRPLPPDNSSGEPDASAPPKK